MFLCVLIYVDDLTVTSIDLPVITRFKEHLNTSFHMKDLDQLKYFLGIEVALNVSALNLSQSKYILDIILRQNYQVPDSKFTSAQIFNK